MDDAYFTIRDEARAELKVKGSRFIGETFLATTVEKALEKLEAVRKREFNATHHCYAYRVGRGAAADFKYSDDGEPSGTAGKPIYDMVTGSDITNVLCVVTRYFGGTKLGTGGLARAYGDTARAVIDRSGRVERFLCTEYRFDLSFSLYDVWQKKLNELGARVTDSDFSDHVTMTVSIRSSRADQLRQAFTQVTAGKGRVEELSRE
jgi:uncharacterized YigZ family protein